MLRVLVVDDEKGVRESLRMLLNNDFDVVTAEGVDEALTCLAETPADLILLDLVMRTRSGFELLTELEKFDPAPPVIVLSATRAIDTAVEAMKRGAADYVTKPFDTGELRIKIDRLLKRDALEREVVKLRAEVEALGSDGDASDRLHGLLGRSAVIQGIFETIRRVASSRATVLICGESGTGKELVARAIHGLGSRSSGPLVALNCAAIPENLIESELFGHERGAFTGAESQRIGRFEAASGGTLFLDEIGELRPPVQAKLLRALEERRVERVGSSTSTDIDVRVLAATNRDLERDVEDGRFRGDLFFRINVIRIELPPLRERLDDVMLLANHFLKDACDAAGRGAVTLSAPVQSALRRYRWPGNVRELANAIEHAVALSHGSRLELSHLPAVIVGEGRILALRDEVKSGRMNFSAAVTRFERNLLSEHLERCDWNQTHTAKSLGMTRRRLKLKMDKLGLKPGASD